MMGSVMNAAYNRSDGPLGVDPGVGDLITVVIAIIPLVVVFWIVTRRKF